MFTKIKKVLVLSAHADDMELGCGGTVHRLIQEGKEVYSLVMSLNKKGLASKFSEQEIVDECMRSASVLGIDKENIFIEKFENRIFPEQRQAILDTIIHYRDKIKPDLVITGSLDDMHQDHVVLAHESFRAFKDYNLISYGFDWNRLNKKADFYFVISEENLQAKIQAVMSYQSQVAGRDYFSENYIRSWAVVRGVEVKQKYAESFQIVRLVV